MDLLNVKKVVETFLIQHERCRNSDARLVAAIWKHYLKKDLDKMQAIDLLQKLADNELPNFESIRRVRQRLQEKNPSLRGVNYKIRKSEDEKIKEQIKLI